MDVKLTYRGRGVTDAEVAFIGGLVADHPTASRRALSQKLCAAWNWVQPNGTPRDMVCRGLLLALHRAGHIQLPPPRYRHIQSPSLARRPGALTATIDTTPLRGPLAALGPLVFQQVRRTDEEPLFNRLIEQHHSL